MKEDVEAIRQYFFEKHVDEPAYSRLRPTREAVLCYIKQNGLLNERERCIKLFKVTPLFNHRRCGAAMLSGLSLCLVCVVSCIQKAGLW